MAVGRPGVTRASTWEDFLALDEDDPRELIDGALVEVDVPTKLHEHIVAWLAFFLAFEGDTQALVWTRRGPRRPSKRG